MVIFKCKHYVSITLVGFSRRWHRTSVPWTKRGSRGGRPHLMYYGYHDNGTLCTGKATSLTEILHKSEIHKRKKFVCLSCGRSSIQLIKKDTDINNCEYCDR